MINFYLYDNKLFLNNINTKMVKCTYLTKIEIAIMNTFFTTLGSYCTYKEILNNIYQENIDDKNIYTYLPTLRVNINRLNKKLNDYVKIKNIYGKGYRLIEKC